MANPLIVFPKQDKTIEDFCREHHFRFEVVEGRIEEASQKVREMVSAREHSSIMLSYHMPSYQWKLVHKEEDINCPAFSDLPYLLSNTGDISIPVSRLPQHPQVAIQHFEQINKEYLPTEEKPKITILYAMPKIDPELQKRARFLLQNETTRRILKFRFLATLRKLLPETEKTTPEEFQRMYSASDHPHIKAFRELYALKNIFDNLQKRGYEILALPEIPTTIKDEWGAKALEHLANSAAVLTLDYQPSSSKNIRQDRASSIHSNGERLVQEEGAVIVSREQLRKREFAKYPLIWFGGCHSGGPRLSQVIMQTGASFVGNTNYGYSLPWNMYGDKEAEWGVVFDSIDLEIIHFLQENVSVGEAHQKYLGLLGKCTPQWKEQSTKILNGESITVSMPEERVLIEILNKSQLWGNAEVKSPLYLKMERDKTAPP